MPTITCPVNQVVMPNTSSLYANVTYTPTGNDLSGKVVSSWCYPSFPALFQLGTTTTVTCSCVDEAGSIATACSFSIQVVDTVPPAIACVPSINTTPTPGFAYSIVNYTPNATDNSLVRSITCSPPFGSPFTLGSTLVQCFATDYAGNKSPNCSITVHVTQTTAPNITCPANVLVAPTPGQVTAQVIYTPTATDAGLVTGITCSTPSGSNFPIGVTQVSCVATNSAGLTSQPCLFNITVSIMTPPVIFCPSNVSVFVTSGLSTGLYIWQLPPAISNYGTATVRCNPVFGTTAFPVGLTTVACSATDVSGNQAFCSFTVRVVDNQYPLISCPQPISIPLSYGAATAIPSFPDFAQRSCYN